LEKGKGKKKKTPGGGKHSPPLGFPGEKEENLLFPNISGKKRGRKEKRFQKRGEEKMLPTKKCPSPVRVKKRVVLGQHFAARRGSLGEGGNLHACRRQLPACGRGFWKQFKGRTSPFFTKTVSGGPRGRGTKGKPLSPSVVFETSPYPWGGGGDAPPNKKERKNHTETSWVKKASRRKKKNRKKKKKCNFHQTNVDYGERRGNGTRGAKKGPREGKTHEFGESWVLPIQSKKRKGTQGKKKKETPKSIEDQEKKIFQEKKGGTPFHPRERNISQSTGSIQKKKRPPLVSLRPGLYTRAGWKKKGNCGKRGGPPDLHDLGTEKRGYQRGGSAFF